MDRYAVGMFDWSGRRWDFTGDWAAGITSGGVDGLVGSVQDTTNVRLGVPGHAVVGQAVDPLRGSLTFHCRAHGGRDAGQVRAELMAAFSPLVSRQSTLVVASPMGEVHTQVRLDGAHRPVEHDPSWDGDLVMNVEVPLIGDDGVWWQDFSGLTGAATVVNGGDVPVEVKIRWSGTGGQVRLPSGAVFTLPAVSAPRTLHLSRAQSLAVTDDQGHLDAGLHRALRSVPPEVVPPGQNRTFVLPPGAEIDYEVGVLNPWL